MLAIALVLPAIALALTFRWLSRTIVGSLRIFIRDVWLVGV
jgi:hypothetical protein